MVTMLGGKENNNNKNNKCDSASGSFKSSLSASSPFREMSKMNRESKASNEKKAIIVTLKF